MEMLSCKDVIRHSHFKRTYIRIRKYFYQAEARVIILKLTRKLTSPFHPPSLVKRYTCQDRRYKPKFYLIASNQS